MGFVDFKWTNADFKWKRSDEAMREGQRYARTFEVPLPAMRNLMAEGPGLMQVEDEKWKMYFLGDVYELTLVIK